MRVLDETEDRGDGSGWRRERGLPSMSEVHGSIAVAASGTSWRKAAAFLGPGYLVAVGYMDPGNWATSLAGGSSFGYALLFVALLSNIMAIILQALAARLAVATGRDLAQACRDAYPAPVAFVLWILAEIAICATDLAEVIGTAIGLNLLFGIPLEIGVIITALDVFLVLYLQTKGFRFVEALVITLLGVIATVTMLNALGQNGHGTGDNTPTPPRHAAPGSADDEDHAAVPAVAPRSREQEAGDDTGEDEAHSHEGRVPTPHPRRNAERRALRAWEGIAPAPGGSDSFARAAREGSFSFARLRLREVS